MEDLPFRPPGSSSSARLTPMRFQPAGKRGEIPRRSAAWGVLGGEGWLFFVLWTTFPPHHHLLFLAYNGLSLPWPDTIHDSGGGGGGREEEEEEVVGPL